MENLASYDSGDESENKSQSSPEKKNNDEAANGNDLTSEWEAFANSIADGSGAVSAPSGVAPPAVSKPSLRDAFATQSLPHGDEQLSTTVVSSDESDSESEQESKKQDSSAESSEQQSSDENADEEEEASTDDEENSDESDETSNESLSEEHDNHSSTTPQKRKISESDDIIKNRFRSESPEDKKAKIAEHAESKTECAAVVKEKSESEETHATDDKSDAHRPHRSSQDGRRRSRSGRGHRSRSRDRRRKRSRDGGSRRSRSDRKGSRDRKDSHSSKHGSDNHKRGVSRRSRDGHGSRRHHSPSRNRHRAKKRSRSTDRRRHRSRDRHSRRSRSKSPIKKKTFKETMRDNILKGQTGGNGTLDFEAIKKHIAAGGKIANPQQLLMRAAMMSSLASGEKVTPQEAVRQQMEAMQQKAQELTGIAVPKYYNPAAVNPLKYAEQMQKRKLLWSKPKEKKEDVNQQLWQATSFGQDKVDEKFRKLMGVKGEEIEMNPDMSKLNEEQIRKHHELFSQLDKEYAMARITTHTHRGIGLGAISFNVPQPQPTTESAPPSSSNSHPPTSTS